jgi:type II secretory pathway component PulK
LSSRRSSSGARGRRRKRHGGGALSILGPVLGSALAGMALFFFVYGLTAKPSDAREIRFRMSAVCCAAAVTVFAARAGFLWLSERRKRLSPGSPFERPGRSGAALVLVLILLGALAALSLRVADLGLSLRRGGRRDLLREDLKAAAWIGLLRGAQALADDEDPASDPADESWMRGEWTHPSGLRLTLRIRDAQDRMDLNALAAIRTGSPSTATDIVAALLQSSGVEEPGLWMERLRTTATAAARTGSDRTERAGCPFVGWDAVRDTVGPERFDAARRNETVSETLFNGLTILPVSRGIPNRVNLQSAPEPVLRALMGPGSEAAVRAFLARREAGPLRGEMGPVLGLDLRRLGRIRDLINVRSEFFHILCTAELGPERVRLSALLRRDADGTCRPIRWGQCP